MRHSPADVRELARIVAAAASARAALSICAGASKQSLRASPADAAVLDISRLAGIVDYQPTELVLTARAATPMEQIEKELDRHNQMLAFEPADWRGLLASEDRYQTLGGVMACNLSGPRRIVAGAARDHFLGVEAVNGRGDTFKAGGKVVKNVTGYDLCKVLAGSFGTLAIMTELTLKVLPRPESTVSVVRSGLTDAEAVRLMTAALNSVHQVSAAAHLPAAVSSNSQATTVFRLEGSRPSLMARCRALCRELSGDFIEEQESRTLWAAVRDVAPFIARQGPVWRLAVPPADACRITDRIARSLSCSWFYDWGGGLVWLLIDPTVPEGGVEVIRAAVSKDGHATLLRAPANLRGRVPTFQPLPAQLARLNARVRQAFDANGVFNHGFSSARS